MFHFNLAILQASLTKSSTEQFLNKDGYLVLRRVKDGCPNLLCMSVASFVAGALDTTATMKFSFCLRITEGVNR